MLLNAFPPALLNAENSVSPQSSVNYDHITPQMKSWKAMNRKLGEARVIIQPINYVDVLSAFNYLSNDSIAFIPDESKDIFDG